MNPTPEEYARLGALFDRAMGMSAKERSGLLAENPELAFWLESMLAEDARPDTVLDRAGVEIAAELMSWQVATACGPYVLEEVVGEGGTGIVYRGRRGDLGSTAAIKILRDAWVSPARRQRFEREQRTLAQLRHPGIASMLDAGVTSEGTPWIAMELVEGVPLDRYAREQQLNVDARLKLFLAVCDAVQYAHGRAIVHRDLKPSNILIDRSGRARLLDFGIARHLDDASADLTRPEFRMFTPAYSAPEQLRGEPTGLYTDVYALGVVLYQLLSGQLPESAGHPAAASPNRAPGPADWDELDLLLGRAMHPEPDQRYRSADALAGDVRRYLASEPLLARPESTWYRSRKFLARHRAAALVAAAFLLTTSVLAGWFTWQLNASRNEAVSAAARAQRVQRFLMNLFEGGDAAAGPAQGLTVQSLIDRGVREAGALDQEPAVQGEVYETLGRMNARLGRYPVAEKLLQAAIARTPGRETHISSQTEWAMVKAEQGQFEAAQKIAREAAAKSAETLGENHHLTIAAQEALGRILTEHGGYAEAIAVMRQALKRREARGEREPLAVTVAALGAAHFYAGRYDEARALTLRALNLRRQVHGEKHPLVGDDWLSLGAIEFDTGRYDTAEEHYRRALTIKRSWYGADHPETASAQTMLGRALVYREKHAEAREVLEQALATQSRVFGEEHARVASTLNDLGNIYVAEKKWVDAERCFRRMEDGYRASRGDGHYLVATAISNRANVYLRQGRFADAEQIMYGVVSRYTQALSAEHVNTAIARIRLGRTILRQKRWRQAAVETRAGYEILAREAKAPVSWLRGAREDLAAAYAAVGNRAEADRFQNEVSQGVR